MSTADDDAEWLCGFLDTLSDAVLLRVADRARLLSIAARLEADGKRIAELKAACTLAEPLLSAFCKVSVFFSSEDSSGHRGPMPVEIHNTWTGAVSALRAALQEPNKGA